MSYRDSVEARLASRLRETASGCWEYTGSRNASGYGTMGINMPGRSRRVALAHRVAAWLWMGVELDGPHETCHACDNPPCCNPNEGHLQIGTHSQNQREAYARGLQPSRSGSRNGNHKLTERKVAKIRQLYATGKYSQTQLAKAAGVNQTNISLIVRGVTWGD